MLEYIIKYKKILYIAVPIIIIAIIISIILTVNIQKEKAEDEVAVTFKDNLTIEFGTKAKVSDFIENIQGELIDDIEVDTGKLGMQKMKFSYKSIRNKKKTKSFEFTVIDTTKPIIYMGNTITIKKGDTTDITSMIFSGDNCDPSPERKITGECDINKVGDYNLTYTVKDSSGNESSQDFTLKVVENTKKNNITSNVKNTIKFSDAIQKYKNNNTKIGIDVSKWQGEIDWQKVKEAGAEFAIIRVGYQKDYDEGCEIDPYFEKNIKGAKEAGLDVGIYFYSYAKTLNEAEEQANWVIDRLYDYEIDLPVAFDWESWNSFIKCNISFYDINEIAKLFIETLQNMDYKGALYSSKNYLEIVWNENNFENVWLAHYISKTDYDKKYYLWQFSNTGRIDGINGDVDIDVLYNE